MDLPFSTNRYRGQYSALFLPPANEVCEGYVFTGVCLSTRGRVSVQGGGSLSRGVSVRGWSLSGGSLSRGFSVWGVSVRETPLDRDPRMITSGRYLIILIKKIFNQLK